MPKFFQARLVWLAAIMMISGGLLLPVFATGGIIYVSPAGTDSVTCGDPADPCASIKYVVETRAQPGNRILVNDGIYTDPFTITTPGLQLIATNKLSGSLVMPAILDGQHTAGPLVTFASGLTETTVFSGFVVQNALSGTAALYFDDSSPLMQGVTVQQNGGDGLYLTANAQPQIHGNTICGNTGFNLHNTGNSTPEARGNWWGTNTPQAGIAYTGTVTVQPPISVSLKLWQEPLGTGSLGSLFPMLPAQVQVNMHGGGYTPPADTAITLLGQGGTFPGGNTITLFIVDGTATTIFTPTGHYSTIISAFSPCNPTQPITTLDFRQQIFLPLGVKNYPPAPPPQPVCPITSTAHFNLIPVNGAPTDHPDILHGDLNLSLRGYEPAPNAGLGWVAYDGNTDYGAPRLQAIVGGSVPNFTTAYQVYDWNWNCGEHGCRGNLLSQWATTLLGLKTTPGQPLYIASRAQDIYNGDYRALVLYAEETRITLSYLREDTVAHGYSIHLENICVDPNLLRLYRSRVKADGYRITAGGLKLPALNNGQSLGTARDREILVAIRDRGNFMDPRSQKDWWQGAFRADMPVERLHIRHPY